MILVDNFIPIVVMLIRYWLLYVHITLLHYVRMIDKDTTDMAPIHYYNFFMHKYNCYPWKPEFYVISRSRDLQYSLQISCRLQL